MSWALAWMLAGLLTAVGCTSTGTPPPEHTQLTMVDELDATTAMGMDMDCEAAIAALNSKDLQQWHGLPKGCDAAKLVSAHGGDIARYATSVRGEAYQQVWHTGMRLPAYAEPARVYFWEGEVLSIAIDHPELPALPALLKSLGEPAAKLDFPFGVGMVKGGEWVWPDRGLALMLREDRKAALKLMVFPAQGLEAYRARLRGVEPAREERGREED